MEGERERGRARARARERDSNAAAQVSRASDILDYRDERCKP